MCSRTKNIFRRNFLLKFIKTGKRTKLIIAAFMVMPAVLFLLYQYAYKDTAALQSVCRGFDNVTVKSASAGVTLKTKYYEADKVSSFSGHKPVKQIIYVKNTSSINKSIPVVFTQRISSPVINQNGAVIALPEKNNPAILNTSSAKLANIVFQSPVEGDKSKSINGRYDWADVFDLKHEVRGWREGTQGVIELKVWKDVAAGAEETIDPIFDIAVVTNFNMRLDGAIGGADYDKFGYSSYSADLNNDGIKDLVVSAQLANTQARINNGAVYVFYGGPGNFTPGTGQTKDMATATNFNLRFDGAVAADKLGCWVDCADLNNDGIDDLIIGTTAPTILARVNSGAAYVIYGGSTNFTAGTGQTRDMAVTTNYNIRFIGAAAYDYLGGVVTHGKINNDAINDLVLSAWGASTQARTVNGAAYVIYGGATNFPAGTGQDRDLNTAANYNMRVDGALNSDQFAYSSKASDLNNDGFDDLILASAFADTNTYADNGAAWVIYGGAVNFPAGTGQVKDISMASSYNVRFDGGNPSDYMGMFMTSGDYNKDGIKDLAVSATDISIGGKLMNGAAYILYGGATNFPAGTGQTRDMYTAANFNSRISGMADSERMGYSMFSGKISNNTYDDLFISSYNGSSLARTNNGFVYYFKAGGPVFPAGTGNIIRLDLTQSYDAKFDGASNTDRIGIFAGCGGDINNDGNDDLIINASYADTASKVDNGAAYVFYGGPGAQFNFTPTPAPTTDVCGLDVTTATGTTLTAGAYNYCYVKVYSGANLFISGAVTITVATDFIVDGSGSIVGDGRGSAGGASGANGTGSNFGTAGGNAQRGGGGGGHTGAGGAGGNIGGVGGMFSELGSIPVIIGAGGAGGGGTTSGAGGTGGAGLKIYAANGKAIIFGNISMAGKQGGDVATADSGGGGGAGGYIHVMAKNIMGSGLISANGGRGGNSTGARAGGGGGGGGLINFCASQTYLFNGSFNITGGIAGTGTGGAGTAGGDGFVFGCSVSGTPVISTATPNYTATPTWSVSPAVTATITPTLLPSTDKWGACGVVVSTPQVNTMIQSIYPDVLSGGAYIAWDDSATMKGHVQKINNSGILQWGTGVNLSVQAGQSVNERLISGGAGGGIIAVWEDTRLVNADIYAQKYDSSGVPQWGADGVLVCNATSGQNLPIACVDGTGGAIIGWIDSRSGNMDIYAQRISSAGSPLWAPNGVTVCTAAGNQSGLAVINDNTGNAVFAWRDPTGDAAMNLYAQK